MMTVYFGLYRKATAVPTRKQKINTWRQNGREPIPGGMPVELKAGDGIVYIHMMLHWGSNYSAKLRQTVHLGYRSFGGPVYPLVNHFYWHLDFTKRMSQKTRERFEHFYQLHEQQCDVIESTFRAILAKDAEAFRNGLAILHPGEAWRLVCVVYLSKLVEKTRTLKQPHVANLSFEERVDAISEHRLNYYLFEDFSRRFSVEEADLLWDRFGTLYNKIQEEIERSVPNLESRQDRYMLTEMPADFDVEDFIASW